MCRGTACRAPTTSLLRPHSSPLPNTPVLESAPFPKSPFPCPASSLLPLPCPYANGNFHIGHIMEYIQADIWVRFQRMQGHEVNFVWCR